MCLFFGKFELKYAYKRYAYKKKSVVADITNGEPGLIVLMRERNEANKTPESASEFMLDENVETSSVISVFLKTQ